VRRISENLCKADEMEEALVNIKNIKWIMCIFMSLCMLGSVQYVCSAKTTEYASYIDDEETGFTYSDTDENGKIEIVGFSDNGRNITNLTIPAVIDGKPVEQISGYISGLDNVKKLIISEGITTIDSYLFVNANSITEVVLPNSLTKICDSAFYGSDSLEKITVPANVKTIGKFAFRNCTKLKEVVISNGTTTIATGAFEGCTSLTKVVIPKSVTQIGASAFKMCTSLKTISLPKNLKSIGTGCFSYCSNLKKITLPSKVKKIPEYSFMYCDKLKTVNFSKNTTSIGKMAFYGCNRLMGIKLPDKLTSIGSKAFVECDSLKKLTIPKSVKKIGTTKEPDIIGILKRGYHDDGEASFADMFYVTTDDHYLVVTKGSYAQKYAKNNGVPYQLTTQKSVKIKLNKVYTVDSVKYKIVDASTDGTGKVQVVGCTNKNIKNVTIGSYVMIGKNLFNVTEIGSEAFSGFKKLESVTCGESIYTIGYRAFYGCKNLKRLVFKTMTHGNVGGEAFKGINKKAVFYQPTSSRFDYGYMFDSYTGYEDTMKRKDL
jgi:hypothetical protein